jgi:hypothetical protein
MGNKYNYIVSVGGHLNQILVKICIIFTKPILITKELRPIAPSYWTKHKSPLQITGVEVHNLWPNACITPNQADVIYTITSSYTTFLSSLIKWLFYIVSKYKTDKMLIHQFYCADKGEICYRYPDLQFLIQGDSLARGF